MDMADHVGYIVGEQQGQGGWYIYACDGHAPEDVKAQTHRQVLRQEAADNGATCHECSLELAEVEGLD